MQVGFGLLTIINILDNFNAEKVSSLTQYIKDFVVSLVELFVCLLMLFFLIRFLVFLSSSNNEIFILPFDVSFSKNNYNGKIISDLLIAEMRKIKDIHSYKFDDFDSDRRIKMEIIGEKIYLPELTPSTENFETKISNLGGLNVAGINVSIFSVFILLRQLWPFGKPTKTIRGNLQEYNSVIHLNAFMDGPIIKGWNIDITLKQFSSVDLFTEMIRDLSYMITYDLSNESIIEHERINANSWIALKHYTESLDNYIKYKKTKKLVYLENARMRCIKAHQEDPNYPLIFNLLYKLANCYFDTTDYYIAEELFNKCISIDPKNKYGYNGLCCVLFAFDLKAESLNEIEKSIEIDSKDAIIWENKANILSHLDLNKESLEAYETSIELDSTSPFAFNGKAYVLIKLKRQLEALEECNKSIEIDPKYDHAWFNKARALIDLRRPKEALEAIDILFGLNKNYENIWHYKGIALGDLGRREEADSAFNKALEINPNEVATWDFKGYFLGLNGKNEEAIEAFYKAIKLDRNNAIAHFNAGYYLKKIGRLTDALEEYNEGLAIDPGDSSALYAKSTILRFFGIKEEYPFIPDDLFKDVN